MLNGKLYGDSSKLKIELTYDPWILHLGIYQRKNPLSQKDIFTPMFTKHYLQ